MCFGHSFKLLSVNYARRVSPCQGSNPHSIRKIVKPGTKSPSLFYLSCFSCFFLLFCIRIFSFRFVGTCYLTVLFVSLTWVLVIFFQDKKSLENVCSAFARLVDNFQREKVRSFLNFKSLFGILAWSFIISLLQRISAVWIKSILDFLWLYLGSNVRCLLYWLVTEKIIFILEFASRTLCSRYTSESSAIGKPSWIAITRDHVPLLS